MTNKNAFVFGVGKAATGTLTIPISDTILLPLASFGPTLAALVLTALSGGWTGVRNLLAGGLRWRVGIAWYGIVLVGPLLIFVAAIEIHLLLSGVPVDFVSTLPVALPMVLVSFLSILFLGGPLGVDSPVQSNHLSKSETIR